MTDMRRAMRLSLLVFCALACAAALSACGGDSSDAGNVTIEPAQSATPKTGGKPAAPRTATAAAEPTPTPEAPPGTIAPAIATPAPSSTPAPPQPTSTPVPPPVAPTEGRWIDVDVTNFAVRLMDGTSVLQEIAPVAVGVAIDTGDYISTQTGLFHVHTKDESLVYDAPFDTYISHWVGFDAEKDNGFHSFLKDESGAVVDPSTGRVSNGCIRVGNVEAVFAFAEIGMPVWVHW